jgi:WD40 repeat protein
MTATAGSATQELVWQLDIGEPVLAINPAADRVIIGGSEGTIVVTDTDGRAQLRLALDDFLLAMAANPDGTRLAVGGGQRLVVFDLADGPVLAEHPHQWCSCLAWATNSGDLAAGDGRLVRVYSDDGRLRWTSPHLQSTVAGLAWMRADGRRLAAAAYQGVKIFEPDTDRMVERLVAPGAIAGLAVAPNGRWVVGGSQDATLHGWNVRDGSDFRMSGFPKTVSRLAFESSGRWMCCDGGDTVVFWDFSGSGPTGREGLLGEGHRDDVTALAWAPTDGTSVLVSGDASGDIALWRLTSRHSPGQRIRPSETIASGDPVGAVAATSNRIFSGHRSGAVRCWASEPRQQAR